MTTPKTEQKPEKSYLFVLFTPGKEGEVTQNVFTFSNRDEAEEMRLKLAEESIKRGVPSATTEVFANLD
jgi:hypothetical protein